MKIKEYYVVGNYEKNSFVAYYDGEDIVDMKFPSAQKFFSEEDTNIFLIKLKAYQKKNSNMPKIVQSYKIYHIVMELNEITHKEKVKCPL